MAIDKSSHVMTELSKQAGKLGIKKEQTKWKIRCPLHAGGRENTPSCSVNITRGPGSFYCFGCKQKGNWNVLAEALNLAGFKKSDQVNDVFSFAMPEVNYSLANPLLEDYKSLKKFNGDKAWRSITPETLQAFDVRFPKHQYFHQDDFLYFPVLVHKNYVGGVYARRVVTKEGKARGEISYINTKGAFSKTNLFGYNLARKRKGPLWIVEGPRDTMKVYQLGGRVVGLLGSYVGPKKLALIEALDPSCVIIATDPDEAGNAARAYIKENLKNIPIYEAVFPDGRDAGNLMPRSYRRMLRKMGLNREEA